MKKPLAVVTMVYNENTYLKIWLKHYLSQVGTYDNLFVIDHGSDDGSTSGLPCVVEKLPRSAGGNIFEQWRAGFVGEYCAKLLNDYSAVLYVDCDEMVVVDPAVAPDLAAYVAAGGMNNATIGYDVLHDFEAEPSLDERPVLRQRNRLLFIAAMCKPTFIRSPARFEKGFHYSDQKPEYGDLYRFHLRYADMDAGLQRLELTRKIDLPELKHVPVSHQTISDDTFRQWVKSWVSYPASDAEIGAGNPDFQIFAARIPGSASNSGMFGFDYSHRGKTVCKVPERFRDCV